MSYLSTAIKTKTLYKKAALIMFAIMCTASALLAQNALVGLTSNGGIDGKGTAFSINTAGNNFSLIKGFADWGNTPFGGLYKDTDGNFYGMTSKGGTNNMGTIFRVTPDGDVTIIKQLFYTTDGAYPEGELIKGPDGYLYGLTAAGGTYSYGTIFKISTSGDFSVIKHLNYAADGANPRGHLMLASDGNFYGITMVGGSTGAGTIFKLTADGIYSVIHTMNYNAEGGTSRASLTEGKGGGLYGTASAGGQYGFGTVFKVATDGSLNVLKHLNSTSDGTYPQSDLIEAKDGNFYGTCYGGGSNGYGTIFRVAKNGAFSVVRSFVAATDGGYAYGGLMQDADGSFYGLTRSSGPKGGGTIYKLTSDYTFSVIHPLDYNTEGSASSSVLVKGNDGSLYAMASAGGTFNLGIIFKTTTAGNFAILNSFSGSDMGNAPVSSFIKGKDSAYYCTMSAGGAYGGGSIIKICGGKTTTLFSFNKTSNGGFPKGDLVLASDGNFYGIASTGGASNGGTLFKITQGGAFSVIKSFNATTDGNTPVGSLIQASNGFLYGMTSGGGSNNGGTIFKIKPSGDNFTVIKSFVFATDGGAPNGSLILANDGNFYGMTGNGGHIFKLGIDGIYNNLHTFVSSTDGYNPMGSLIQGIDGSLYGTCSDGGANSGGTVFRMSLAGNYKVLIAFNAAVQGRMPKGTLLQGADGTLYGLTSIGGTYNTGTIFKISPSGNNFNVLRHMNLATDGGNAYGGLIFAPVNNLIADAKTSTVNEDTTVKITLSGSGGSSLEYTVTKNPEHGKLTGKAPKLTYKPNKNFYGTDKFSYAVNTGCIASASAVVTITIKPVADTPVLASIGNKTIAKNTILKFRAKATDADSGQTIKYSLIGSPSGTKINASTGVFTWTPTVTGKYIFKVRATDNDTPALFDEEQITVTVTYAFAGLTSDEEDVDAATAAINETVKVNVYPNPASDVLHIRLQIPTDNLLVRIFNEKGNQVAAYNFNHVSKTACDVNVSKLSQGMYFIQLQSEEFNKTIRFMKN